MNPVVEKCLSGLEVGEGKGFENLEVFPIFFKGPAGPAYLTLSEALAKGILAVTEVSAGGHVPELKVVNKGETPVLLLDGEELAGARQNRVLNTSILVRGNAETIIPVSCTEQGRWQYVSREFKDSGIVMPATLRAANVAAVSESLKAGESYASDQSGVWDGVARCMMECQVSSPTSALRDVYEKEGVRLADHLRAFPAAEGQRGLAVLIRGSVAGFDYVSSASAYSVLHAKLVKSYALASMTGRSAGQRPSAPASAGQGREALFAFLSELRSCSESRHRSVGCGWDLRYRSAAAVGSALVHEDAVIHAAFFRPAAESEMADHGPLAGYQRRRGYRFDTDIAFDL